MLKNYWNKLLDTYKTEVHKGITSAKISLVNSLMLFNLLTTFMYLVKFNF